MIMDLDLKIYRFKKIYRKFTRTLLAFITFLSLIVFIPMQGVEIANASPVGSCDSAGVVGETSSGGFYTVKYELTAAANTAGTNSSCTYTVPSGVTRLVS